MSLNIRTARGFSLVELMVAMAIGLILLTVLAIIVANSSRSQKEITLSAQQIENGRTAMDILGDDIHHAGYWGYYFGAGTAPGSLPDPCDVSAAGLTSAMSIPVQAYNAPGASPLSCLAGANYLAGTDILVLRHASTSVAASLSATGVYIQSTPKPTDSNNPIVATGTGTFNLTARNGSGTNVTAPIRGYEVHIYFISPCSVPSGSGGTVCASTDDGGAPIPTLKRLELNQSTGTLKLTPLVEGIENLQIDYGIDSDGDGAPDGGSFIADPGSVANWQKVMALQVYVLARNTQSSSDFTDLKSYTLGTTAIPAATGSAAHYRRHVYAATLRLKNPSERLAP